MEKRLFKFRCLFLSKRCLAITTKDTSELKVNNNLVLHPDCKKCLANGTKPRKHSGVIKISRIQLPFEIESSIKIVIEKYPFKNLKNKSEEFFDYLWSRKLPVEENDLKLTMAKLTNNTVEKENLDMNLLSEDELCRAEQKVKNKVITLMKSQIYNWKPIKYDAFSATQYLFSRSCFDYAATYRVLYELANRSKLFKPQTILHFGSGVGSSVWAANELWGNKIKEHMCVDQSSEMNTLARLVLQGGCENSNLKIPGVYFRQFFSPSPKVKYDIVISAFTFFEMPNKALRLQMIENLWAKSDKYLILIENGTNSGFQIINEARERVLEMNTNTKNEKVEAHIFAPCPHDSVCPRYERNDGTPCNFVTSYVHLNKTKTYDSLAKFSYVVFERGARNTEQIPWRRIIRPVKELSKRVFVQTCTPEGILEYSVITAKQNSKDLYSCAKACSWGDLLPAITDKEKNYSSANDEIYTDVPQNISAKL